MGKGPGQDGKLLAFERANPRQRADVLAADLTTGNRWETRQAGGWYRGFGKQVSGGAVLRQDLIALKSLSNRVTLLSRTTGSGHSEAKEAKRKDKIGSTGSEFKVRAALA